jgi:hypothetical protein
MPATPKLFAAAAALTLLVPCLSAGAVGIREVQAWPDIQSIAFDRYGTKWTTHGAYISHSVPGYSTGFLTSATELTILAASRYGEHVWALDRPAGKIYRFGGGAGGPFTIPTPNSQPCALVEGPDGNVWFAEWAGNKIGRMTPSGTFTEFPLPTPISQPSSITVGSDGNLWFVEYNANKLGRITPAGVLTEFPIPTIAAYPRGIAAGPDLIAFTETGQGQIGFFDMDSETFEEFPIPTPNSSVQQIVWGGDRAFWFTELLGNKIGRISTGGSITEHPLPSASAEPRAMAVAPDGDIWFVEEGVGKVGYLQLVVAGDANADGAVDVLDVFYTINFLFAGGPAPK